MKKLFAVFGVFVLSLALVMPASAATFGSGEEYTVPGDQITEGNLYVSGATLMVDGAVQGDLIAAGANVWVNGDISEDATLASANLTVNSKIAEDLRIASANATINSEIGGELVAAGGYIIISSNTVIEKDAVIAGGRILVDGTINGDLVIYGDEVEIKGTVLGNVKVEAGTNFVLTETAKINGNLDYKASTELTIPEEVVGGEVMYSSFTKDYDAEQIAGIFAAIVSTIVIVKMLSLMLFGVVLYFIFRKFAVNMLEQGMKDYWKNALTGFITVILLPIVIVLILVTILGIPFAMLAGLIFAVLVLLAKVVAGMLFGSLIFRIFTKKKDIYTSWYAILVGIFALCIFSWIPVLGWFLRAIMFLAAFGLLATYTYQGLLKLKK